MTATASGDGTLSDIWAVFFSGFMAERASLRIVVGRAEEGERS